MKALSRALQAAVIFGVAACDGGVSEPQMPPPRDVAEPGFLDLVLTTPNSNDGIVLLTLSGGVMDSIRAKGSAELLDAIAGINTVRVLLAGDIGSGVVLEFWVPDRRLWSTYRAILDQVAARGTYEQRESLQAYVISVRR